MLIRKSLYPEVVSVRINSFYLEETEPKTKQVVIMFGPDMQEHSIREL